MALFNIDQNTKTLVNVDYLGGYGDTKKGKGNLTLNPDNVDFKAIFNNFTIPKDRIKGIAIEGSDVASKRITATRLLAVGIFAFAFKKQQKEAFLTVELDNGQEAIFRVEKILPKELQAKLSTLLALYNRPANTPAPTPTSTADEILKLAKLHKQGVLTRDEFNIEKNKILGR